MNYSNHTDGHVDSHGGYDTDSRFTRDAYVLDRENIPYDRYFPESSVPPRLRHQVLVDGRLVDSWTERVEGTRWEQVARDFDAESRCPHQLFPSRPLRHPFEEVLDWLEGLVGGPQHLDALDTVALTVPARPVLEDPWQSDQLDAVESLLDSVAVKLFGGTPSQHSAKACCTCGTTVPTSSCTRSRPRTRQAVSAGPSVAPTAGSTRTRTSGRRTFSVTCG